MEQPRELTLNSQQIDTVMELIEIAQEIYVRDAAENLKGELKLQMDNRESVDVEEYKNLLGNYEMQIQRLQDVLALFGCDELVV